MNKKNATQCESCTEHTKRLVFCDGEDDTSWCRWTCHNTECPYNDTAEEQKLVTEKRQEVHEINLKNGVDALKLTRFKIREQLNLVEAAEIVGVRTAQYSAWEYERKPIPVDKYNVMIKNTIRRFQIINAVIFNFIMEMNLTLNHSVIS